MLKTAIVGCGAIAQTHAAALADMESTKLVAAADIRPERARALTETYGGTAYASMEEMLAAEKPDVIHICTPHYTHTPLAVQALEYAHVLLEKPCGVAVEEIETLAGAQRESGKTLGICFQNRYKETSVRAKKLLESGALGKVLGARGFVTWKRDAAYYAESGGWRGRLQTAGGGVMINQAIHTLDLMIWLVGDPLTVQAAISNRHMKGLIEVEDTAEYYLDFGGGVSGVFYATTAHCTDSPVYLEIVCENGSLVLEGDRLTVRDGDGAIREDWVSTPPAIGGKICWGGCHRILFEDFYGCLQSGREFSVGPAEGGRALRVLLRGYESSAAGAPVAY